MHDLLFLREYYGLSQANLAVYLSVSESLIKMVEAGKRELPSLAALKIAWFQQAMLEVDVPTEATEPIKENAQKHIRQLRLLISRMVVQIQKNERELVTMKDRYHQALRRATLIVRLRNKDLPATELEKDELWLDVQQTATKAALQQYGKGAQAILEWKTATLLYSKKKAQAYEKVLQQVATK